MPDMNPSGSGPTERGGRPSPSPGLGALPLTARSRKIVWPGLAIALAAAGLFLAWYALQPAGLPAGIASGNGRVEAVEIDIDSKVPGRILDILVDEGDFVSAGQVLARMDSYDLDAQLRGAQADLQRALIGVRTAGFLVKQREAELEAAQAVVAQDRAQQVSAALHLQRSSTLVRNGAVPQQSVDDDRAALATATAAVASAQAQVAAADAAIETAKSQVIDADAAVDVARAQVQRIEVDIDDSTLRAPCDGRVEYRIAEPGEVLGAGGRVLEMVDLSNVYMTFFLPTDQAGRVALGAEVRIVLDAAPQYVIPARITYVADVAQFTPKTVETEDERAALMFRIKARIPPELLRKHINEVKTGLPGMAYVQLDPKVPWPDFLRTALTP